MSERGFTFPEPVPLPKGMSIDFEQRLEVHLHILDVPVLDEPDASELDGDSA